MKRNYYTLLGVHRSASSEEIKRAYRKLALRFHPDRNSAPDAERRFQEVNEAYAVLSNPEQRIAYDDFGQRGGGDPLQNGSVSQGDLKDIFGADLFEELFSSLFNERKKRSIKDLRVSLPVSYEQALDGGRLSHEVSRLRRCDGCHGVGTESGRASPVCESCQGQGRVRVKRGFLTLMQRCERCHGRGVLISDPCKRCQGSGRRRRTELLEVDLPPRCPEGQMIFLRGEGDEIAGNFGDLYLEVQYQEHPRLGREGEDLVLPVQVSYPLLALGGILSIEGLSGPLQLTIASGSPLEQRLRLRGEGLPQKGERERGDLLLQLQLSVPRSLSEEAKAHLEALRELEGRSAPETAEQRRGSRGRLRKILKRTKS